MIGKLLDRRYRIIKELAEGGFSQTYLAEDTRLPKNPQCVVKHLNPTIDDPIFTQKALELFKAEAETLQELGRHDRIPQLYAYFQENKEFYLVQEYIAGHPLSREMTPGSQMAEARVAQIVREILEILQFVHQFNVIHRDIKPSNLIRRHSDGKLVLIDFGTVKQVQMEVAAHHKARVTLPIGTPGYMSYEQERGQSVASSDIYSLGMVALQALTGKHPSQFPRDRENEISWRSFAKVDREFAAILDRMTRCNPRDRYQTVDEVLKDLAKLPKLSMASPRIMGDDLDGSEGKKPTKRRDWWWRSLVVIGAIATIGMVSYEIFLVMTSARVPYQSQIKPPAPAPIAASPQTTADTPSFDRLSNYLRQKNWEAADQETYLILLKAAGQNSYADGTFHADELGQINCAELLLIDQLWTQASNGKQGITAQKRIYENSGRDLQQTYTAMGWLIGNTMAIDTFYNRQTSRWEYLSGRQPNFKSPPTGHLPFLLRDSSINNLSKMIGLYRCS